MIKFFISSTFRDMFGERNLLQKEILPELREFGRLKGEYVDLCDLRWGMNPQEGEWDDRLMAIMDVCIHEIDNCNNCFIAFLGDSYGTITEDPGSVKTLLGKYGCTLTDYAISLTQMELDYVMWKRNGCRGGIRPICMVRDFDDEGSQFFREQQGSVLYGKQQALREHFQKLAGQQKVVCIHYQAKWDKRQGIAKHLDGMKKCLLEEAKKVIEEEAGKKEAKNWVEQEFLDADAFCTQATAYFGGREQILGKILSAAKEEGVNTIGVSGASGCGKSTLLAKVRERLAGTVCFIACGRGARSRTYLDVLKQLVYFVESQTTPEGGICKINDSFSEERLEEGLRKAIEKYEKEGAGQLVLIVDALDKISSYGAVAIHQLLRGLAVAKVLVICSRIQEMHSQEENFKEIKVGSLTREDIQSIINKNVSGEGNCFQGIADWLGKKQGAASPLYVTAAWNVLHIKTMDYRGSRQIEFCQDLVAAMPNGIQGLIWENIEAAGEFIGYPLYQKAVGFLAASQDGLRESDLAGILQEDGWITVDFVLFRKFLGKFFRCQPNGCWAFSHDLVQASVQEKLQGRMEGFQRRILTYLRELGPNDEVRVVEGLWASAKVKDDTLAKEIMEEAARNPDLRILTRIMAALQEIASQADGREWFCSFCRKHPSTVERVLDQGLMHHGNVDYNRRYPAKILADIYIGKKSQEELLKMLAKRDSLESKLGFVSFCAEYVGIYEDISKHVEVFGYEAPVYQFLCSQEFGALSEGQKSQVFRQANGVFYANNRIINDIRRNRVPKGLVGQEAAEEISKGMIGWADKNIFGTGCRFAGRNVTEGKFLNNIAQYYAAHENYGDAQEYRRKALLIKTGDLMDLIAPGQKGRLLAELRRILAGPMGQKDAEAFWRQAQIYLGQRIGQAKGQGDQESKNSEITAISDKWGRAAVSYQTIGFDFYLDYEKGKKEERLWTAEWNMGQALRMLNAPDIVKQERERGKSKIFMAGIAGSFFTDGLVQKDDAKSIGLLLGFIENTTEDVLKNLSRDKYELDKLSKNIEKFQAVLPQGGKEWLRAAKCLERIQKASIEDGRGI